MTNNYLTFSSAEPFTIGVKNATKNWDVTLYYSTDASVWNEWDGSTDISSAEHNGEQRIYMRGVGNSVITGDVYQSYWALTGSSVRCDGNIENLLDYETVANGGHPTMGEYCYDGLFFNWTALTTAPELPATTLSSNCYAYMFAGCTALTTAPELPATTVGQNSYGYMFDRCTGLTTAPALPATTLSSHSYYCMFSDCTGLTTLPALPATELKTLCYGFMFCNCTGIKLSTTQTDEYQTEYRIPISGTGTFSGLSYLSPFKEMFKDTGGTFAGSPEVNTTYYTSNTIIDPQPDEPETVLSWQKHDAYEPNSNSIAYLYNGVELPDINRVWTDKATYPCAIIALGITNGTYYLTVCGDKPYYTEQSYGTEGYEPIVVAPKPFKGFSCVGGSWVLNTVDTGYGAALRTGTFELIWTNVDVMNKDNGSVYFNGSDPVIKGLDGNTFYRVMGGKWVNQDAMNPSLIKDEPTGEPIAYLYNGVRLPDINEVWTDKGTYPYAAITRVTYDDGTESIDTTLLCLCNTPAEYRDNTISAFFPAENKVRQYQISDNGFELASEEESTKAFTVLDGYDVYTLIWSSHDILLKHWNDDKGGYELTNEVYFAASDPVPVYE